VLKRKVTRGSLSELFDRQESTTLEYLQNEGFSNQFIDHFFRPFFSGVFFESKLTTTSRMFEFVFRVLSQGDGALPEEGIGALSQELARRIPEEAVSLNARVDRLDGEGVLLESGERIGCRAVVLATDAQQASRFLGDSTEVPYVSSLCLSYAADRTPVKEPILVLNGEGAGPITNLCVPSQVASSYAPKGKAQVVVTVVEQSEKGATVEPEVRDQLREWFGRGVDSWRLLRAWPIEKALPHLEPPTQHPERQAVRRGKGIYVCGEYGSLSSFQWAMHSGRRAGEAVVEDLAG
jgi:phytoene dehydrogenase-like protein